MIFWSYFEMFPNTEKSNLNYIKEKKK